MTDHDPLTGPASPGAGAAPGPPPASTSPAKPFPGIAQAWGLLFLVWGGIIAVATVVVAADAVRHGGQITMPSTAVLLLAANSGGFLIALAVGWMITRRPLGEVFSFRRFPPVILVPLAMLGVGGATLLSELDTLFRFLPFPQGFQDFIRTIDQSTLDMIHQSYWAAVVALVVMAPLTEELFFRGLLLQGFLRRYPLRKAMIASAAFFALAHLTPNQLIPAFLAGLFFAWMVARTRNLWLSIATHAVFNGLAALAVKLSGPGAESLPARPAFQPWWMDLAALALVAAGFFWARAKVRAMSAPVV